VKRHDTEVSGRVVEYAQLQEVAQRERIVGDRLLRDDDAVVRRVQPSEHLARRPAEEVGVAQARAAGERRRVDAEDVLQVGPDVRVRMVDGRNAGDPRDRRDP